MEKKRKAMDEIFEGKPKKLSRGDERNPGKNAKNFFNLPEELKEMILDLLSIKDLLNFSTANKFLNEFIGQNERFMKKCRISVSLFDENTNWISWKNYESIIFEEEENIQKIRQLQNWLGNSVRELTFMAEMNQVMLKSITFYKNLEKLFIKSIVNMNTDAVVELENNVLPNLKTLEIGFSNENLRAFNFTKLKCLKVKRIESNGKAELKNLIMKQETLADLTVCDFNNLCEDNSLTKVKFRLKKIGIRHAKFELHQKRHLKTFLELHKNTLMEIECCSIQMLINFERFKNVTMVKLTKPTNSKPMDMSKCAIMKNVRILHLSCVTVQQSSLFKKLNTIEHNFPSLEELKIQNGSSTFAANLFGTLKNLKVLELKDMHKTSDMRIPFVQKMKFENFQFCSTKDPFHFAGNRIQHLSILNCSNLQWLERFISTDTKLEYLKIKNSEIPDGFQEICEKKIHKVLII